MCLYSRRGILRGSPRTVLCREKRRPLAEYILPVNGTVAGF